MVYICDICGLSFHSKPANLRKHLRLKHNIQTQQNFNIKCREEGCTFSCSKLDILRFHLETRHNINQEVEEMMFRNIEEFSRWKSSEEARAVAFWTKGSIMPKKRGTTIYYYCNRSGKKRLKDESQKLRRFKRGSCKLDSFCTSAITAKLVPLGIKVKYFKTHYRHDNEVEYVPLREEERRMIATHLIQGLPPNKIIEKFKSDPYSSRLRLLTRTDIANISREFNLCLDHDNALPVRTRRINETHELAINTKAMIVIKFEDGWSVLSGGDSFVIRRGYVEEGHICKVYCEKCLCCVHSYSCSCIDFVARRKICKHIHKVALAEKTENDEGNEEEVLLHTDDDEEIRAMHEQIKTNINSILIMFDSSESKDLTTLCKINEHLSEALELLKAEEKDRGETVQPQLDNQNYCIVLPTEQNKEITLIESEVSNEDEATHIMRRFRPIAPLLLPEPLVTQKNVTRNVNELAHFHE